MNSPFVMPPKKDSWSSNWVVNSLHMIRDGVNRNAQIRQEKHDFYGGFVLVH